MTISHISTMFVWFTYVTLFDTFCIRLQVTIHSICSFVVLLPFVILFVLVYFDTDTIQCSFCCCCCSVHSLHSIPTCSISTFLRPHSMHFALLDTIRCSIFSLLFCSDLLFIPTIDVVVTGDTLFHSVRLPFVLPVFSTFVTFVHSRTVIYIHSMHSIPLLYSFTTTFVPYLPVCLLLFCSIHDSYRRDFCSLFIWRRPILPLFDRYDTMMHSTDDCSAFSTWYHDTVVVRYPLFVAFAYTFFIPVPSTTTFPFYSTDSFYVLMIQWYTIPDDDFIHSLFISTLLPFYNFIPFRPLLLFSFIHSFSFLIRYCSFDTYVTFILIYILISFIYSTFHILPPFIWWVFRAFDHSIYIILRYGTITTTILAFWFVVTFYVTLFTFYLHIPDIPIPTFLLHSFCSLHSHSHSFDPTFDPSIHLTLLFDAFDTVFYTFDVLFIHLSMILLLSIHYFIVFFIRRWYHSICYFFILMIFDSTTHSYRYIPGNYSFYSIFYSFDTFDISFIHSFISTIWYDRPFIRYIRYVYRWYILFTLFLWKVTDFVRYILHYIRLLFDHLPLSIRRYIHFWWYILFDIHSFIRWYIPRCCCCWPMTFWPVFIIQYYSFIVGIPDHSVDSFYIPYDTFYSILVTDIRIWWSFDVHSVFLLLIHDVPYWSTFICCSPFDAFDPTIPDHSDAFCSTDHSTFHSFILCSIPMYFPYRCSHLFYHSHSPFVIILPTFWLIHSLRYPTICQCSFLLFISFRCYRYSTIWKSTCIILPFILFVWYFWNYRCGIFGRCLFCWFYSPLPPRFTLPFWYTPVLFDSTIPDIHYIFLPFSRWCDTYDFDDVPTIVVVVILLLTILHYIRYITVFDTLSTTYHCSYHFHSIHLTYVHLFLLLHSFWPTFVHSIHSNSFHYHSQYSTIHSTYIVRLLFCSPFYRWVFDTIRCCCSIVVLMEVLTICSVLQYFFIYNSFYHLFPDSGDISTTIHSLIDAIHYYDFYDDILICLFIDHLIHWYSILAIRPHYFDTTPHLLMQLPTIDIRDTLIFTYHLILIIPVVILIPIPPFLIHPLTVCWYINSVTCSWSIPWWPVTISYFIVVPFHSIFYYHLWSTHRWIPITFVLFYAMFCSFDHSFYWWEKNSLFCFHCYSLFCSDDTFLPLHSPVVPILIVTVPVRPFHYHSTLFDDVVCSMIICYSFILFISHSDAFILPYHSSFRYHSCIVF